jgi:hypothetical protein
LSFKNSLVASSAMLLKLSFSFTNLLLFFDTANNSPLKRIY